jgi:hypothetical protein
MLLGRRKELRTESSTWLSIKDVQSLLCTTMEVVEKRQSVNIKANAANGFNESGRLKRIHVQDRSTKSDYNKNKKNITLYFFFVPSFRNCVLKQKHGVI